MKAREWYANEAAGAGNEWPPYYRRQGPLAEVYWANKEHIDALSLGRPQEEEMRSNGWQCRLATDADIPAVIP
eukprot:1838928-Lingulodinium_polyedra.AAC.1